MNDKNSSISMLKNALSPQGFNFADMKLGTPKKDFTVITSPRGNMLTVASENPVFPFKTCSARLIANDKLKAYDFAKLQGVSIPKTVLQSQADATEESLKLLELNKSLIVKPKKGSGSKGLTLDINNATDLQAAITYAKNYHDEVIVQEQFFGEEVRFVVVNGNVEAAIIRQKPRVIGDGNSTVAQLIGDEELQRKALHSTQLNYPMLHDVISNKDHFTNNTVLSSGQVYELGKGTMIKTGASMYNIISEIHKDYIEVAQKLTSLFGKGFIVVDIMIADYLQAASEDNYAFIEFNLAPALSLFYSCRNGEQFNLVEDFLVGMIKELMDGS